MTDPGALVIEVSDHTIGIELVGGGSWSLPIGAVSLVERELERADRPAPEQLTNALGIVTDHLDDVLRESPLVATPTSVHFVGHHAAALGCLELGRDHLPDGYALSRPDADEVFRTVVAEPIAERLHNPGLAPDDVETVIGTCCCVLAVMRRLELGTVSISADSGRH